MKLKKFLVLLCTVLIFSLVASALGYAEGEDAYVYVVSASRASGTEYPGRIRVSTGDQVILCDKKLEAGKLANNTNFAHIQLSNSVGINTGASLVLRENPTGVGWTAGATGSVSDTAKLVSSSIPKLKDGSQVGGGEDVNTPAGTTAGVGQVGVTYSDGSKGILYAYDNDGTVFVEFKASDIPVTLTDITKFASSSIETTDLTAEIPMALKRNGTTANMKAKVTDITWDENMTGIKGTVKVELTSEDGTVSAGTIENVPVNLYSQVEPYLSVALTDEGKAKAAKDLTEDDFVVCIKSKDGKNAQINTKVSRVIPHADGKTVTAILDVGNLGGNKGSNLIFDYNLETGETKVEKQNPDGTVTTVTGGSTNTSSAGGSNNSSGSSDGSSSSSSSGSSSSSSKITNPKTGAKDLTLQVVYSAVIFPGLWLLLRKLKKKERENN